MENELKNHSKKVTNHNIEVPEKKVPKCVATCRATERIKNEQRKREQ